MNSKILLVEDEAIISMQERNVIEDAGFTVIQSYNGEEAVAIVDSEEDLSLVLMDIDLGDGIDGTEAASIILESKDLPIVFLTSHNEKEMVDKVKHITNYGYVIKSSGQFVLIESINMALELHKAHYRLKRSEIEYREIVDGINNAILKFDADGRIIYFSKGAERIFGFSSDEVIGKLSIDTINPSVDSEGVDHSMMLSKIFRAPGEYTNHKNENVTKEGRRLWMQWFNKAVFDQKGKKMYVLAIGEVIAQR